MLSSNSVRVVGNRRSASYQRSGAMKCSGTPANNPHVSAFFFQAEDGIRAHCVTGVQTCALPICTRLDGAALRQLRRDTAWVDPVVHLWNRSLFDNLAYGAPPGVDAALGQVIHETGLYDLLRKLPRGLQTPLGDSGGLVSAGEGERVRFGRALLRAHARLVILDEPFRGLERQHRRELLARARERWRHAT